ncbi:hypothetical protein DFH09DRAFT_1184421 [Mycena vulgaris]|nr:hypothetical protein DFH09DRAFT_1184421 [Mycena vulgaris]
MSLTDFPPELLTKIFLNLSYKCLLSVLAVSVQWNDIVKQDPALSVQIFKRRSMVYVAPGCCESFKRGHGYRYAEADANAAEPIRLHPAVQTASYIMGSRIVYFWTNAASDPQVPPSAIANDFISIPAVTMVNIEIGGGFGTQARNMNGVRLIDLFRCIKAEANRKFMSIELRILTVGDLLGDHVHYEGLDNVVRTGLGISARLMLGS